MTPTTLFFVLGASLTLIGMIMLVLSFKSTHTKIKGIGEGPAIRIMDTVPNLFSRGKKLIKIAVAALFFIFLMIWLALMNPNMIGW